MATGEFAEVNGTRLYYEEAGSGPPVIFVHGFTLDTRMWDPQFEVFATRYRAIRYDARGFGRSAPSGDEPFSDADDLKALMDHLGISEASLIGLSMGGSIIVSFAMRYLEYVTCLVPVDAGFSGGPRMPEFAAALEHIGQTAKTDGVAAAIQEWLTCLLFEAENENPELAAELARIVGDYSGERWTDSVPVISDPIQPYERLSQIDRPTLVIVGERDISQFHESAGVFLRHIKGSRRVVIPGAGHMANMCAPEPFNEATLEFFETVHRARPVA